MSGIKHLLLKLEAAVTRCESRKITGRRMAGDASAAPLEELLAGLNVAGLKVRGIDTFSSANAPASAGARQRNVLLGVNKGCQAGNLLIRTIKGRHASVRPSIAHNRADLVSIHIRGHQL